LYVEFILDEQIEQRFINLKFLGKFENSVNAENDCLLTDVYEDDVMLRPRVFGLHKRFREGCEEVDDLRPCCSCFSNKGCNNASLGTLRIDC